MLCRTLALVSVLALALAAQAREPQSSRADAAHAGTDASGKPDSATRSRAGSDADAAQQEILSRQKRRDVLREALRGQVEESPAAMRQMSLQERMELRQQLRQQQEWLK